MEYNIYCDESCHLENDKQKAMVLGAMWCSFGSAKKIFQEVRDIKKEFGLAQNFEIKWNKISQGKVDFYLRLVEYFFSNEALHFRTLVVPDKSILNHDAYNQSHDEFYYKMYFDMLKIILSPQDSYNIYLDIKDTQSQYKIERLKKYLQSTHYDYDNRIIQKIQHIRSHEVEIVQLTDLFIGAFSYLHRGLRYKQGKRRNYKTDTTEVWLFNAIFNFAQRAENKYFSIVAKSSRGRC